MTTSRKFFALLLVILSSIGIVGTTATPALAGGPIVYNQRGGSIPMYYGTRSTSSVQQWLPQSSRFDMKCWYDDQWYNGNYNTNRWFYGQTYSTGSWGFVPASYVYYQWNVPRCP